MFTNLAKLGGPTLQECSTHAYNVKKNWMQLAVAIFAWRFVKSNDHFTSFVIETTIYINFANSWSVSIVSPSV